MHEALHRTKECMLNEIEKINNRGTYDDRDLDNLMKATKVLINVEGIKGMEEYADNSYYGFSKGMGPNTTYPQSYGGMSMGYPQDMRMMDRSWDGRMNSMANYENNRSNHSISDRMIASLEQQMNTAQTDYERQQILAEIKHIRENQNK
jgi:hypothetical protein